MKQFNPTQILDFSLGLPCPQSLRSSVAGGFSRVPIRNCRGAGNEFYHRRKGFTLIELLVVVSLVGIIMVATVGLLLSVLRGSRKSEALSIVKQNGDHVLELISTRVRNARAINSCPGNTSLSVTNPDGGETIFSCSGETISSNSAVLVSSGVSNCAFICNSGSRGVPASTTVQFTLTSGQSGVEQASTTFNTTVSLRNY